eukprot:351893-Chlamydomonas_euryale.AAC.28
MSCSGAEDGLGKWMLALDVLDRGTSKADNKTLTLSGPKAWSTKEIIEMCEDLADSNAQVTTVPAGVLKAARAVLKSCQWAKDAADRLAFAEVLSGSDAWIAPMEDTYKLLDIEPSSVTGLEEYLKVSLAALLSYNGPAVFDLGRSYFQFCKPAKPQHAQTRGVLYSDYEEAQGGGRINRPHQLLCVGHQLVCSNLAHMTATSRLQLSQQGQDAGVHRFRCARSRTGSCVDKRHTAIHFLPGKLSGSDFSTPSDSMFSTYALATP